MQVCTCEAGDMFDVFARVGDTCELFDSAVARVCVVIAMCHTCVYTRC